MMQLYYEAADGTILNLMKDGIYAQDPETLTQNTWSYTTISGVNGLARVKRFFKNVQTAKMKLSIMAADKEEFNAIMYAMHRIFEKDVRNMTPGKIWWNNFYKEGFVYSTSNDDYEELFESVEHKVPECQSFLDQKDDIPVQGTDERDGNTGLSARLWVRL